MLSSSEVHYLASNAHILVVRPQPLLILAHMPPIIVRECSKSCIKKGCQSWVQYLLRSFGAAYSFYHEFVKYEKAMIKGEKPFELSSLGVLSRMIRQV